MGGHNTLVFMFYLHLVRGHPILVLNQYKIYFQMDTSFFIDTSGNIRKCPIIYKLEGSVCTPMVYIHKPKYVSNSEFTAFVDSLNINVDYDKFKSLIESLPNGDKTQNK